MSFGLKNDEWCCCWWMEQLQLIQPRIWVVLLIQHPCSLASKGNNWGQVLIVQNMRRLWWYLRNSQSLFLVRFLSRSLCYIYFSLHSILSYTEWYPYQYIAYYTVLLLFLMNIYNIVTCCCFTNLFTIRMCLQFRIGSQSNEQYAELKDDE